MLDVETGGFGDGCCGRVGRPRDTLDDMLVAAQLVVSTLGRATAAAAAALRGEQRRTQLPHEYGLIVGARGHVGAVVEQAHLAHPVAVAE